MVSAFDKLSPKHRQFCQAYAACGVGARAAIQAGYRPNYAHELLRKPAIRLAIAELEAAGAGQNESDATKAALAGLNARQQRFCREYFEDPVACRAAVRAGYRSSTGQKLLRHPKVAAALAVLQAERSEALRIRADRVVQELGKIAFANVADFARQKDGRWVIDIDEAARNAPAIAELRVEASVTPAGVEHQVRIAMRNKIRALRLLARHLGLLH